MQLNNAMQNMMLCHFGEVTRNIVGGDYRRVFVQLKAGPMPSQAKVDAIWVGDYERVSPKFPGSILLSQAGYAAFDIPLDTTKRILRTDSYPETSFRASGTIGYAIVYIVNSAGYTYMAYLLTVGLEGSGADMELKTLDVVAGDKFKLDSITLDHSFILAGA